MPPERRAADREPAARAAWLAVEWAGPWDRVAGWLGRKPAGSWAPWRAGLIRWLGRHESRWLAGYASRLAEPPARWRRHPVPHGSGEEGSDHGSPRG